MNGVDLFKKFVEDHKSQLESSAIPHHLWKALHAKLAHEIFDAGEHFQLMMIEYGDDDEQEIAPEARPIFCLSAINPIKADDPNAIFLIDHAWTFRMDIARQQLSEYKGLTDRLCVMTGVDAEDSNRIEKVMQNIWRYCQAYTIRGNVGSDEEHSPIWYVMDEVGCAVNHSDEPNFRILPFYYNNTQTTYSLLFPIRDCADGEQICRDFIECAGKDVVERSAMLLFWQHKDLRLESFLQVEPGSEYFLAGHIPETLPEICSDEQPVPSKKAILKVYAEYEVLRQYLTNPLFELVDNKDDADVLWLTNHFKNFAELATDTPQKFINQFPFEYVLTIKDLLSIICRRASKEHHNEETLETYPKWMPTTYNLKTELVQFASYYQHRQAKGLDNHWIVKPWNLARGLDTHITDNITEIVRLSATGPKIAQKYIENPVLFHRSDLGGKVKFDIRYCVLVKSISPLKAYVYRKFFLRFANKTFGLNNLHDYEQHFTVMNYKDNSNLYHLPCDDFLVQWKEQYPEHEWAKLEDEICHTLFELLECAKKCPPPMGIAHNRQSRALYAADIMLEWSDNEFAGGQAPDHSKRMQTKLLEVNWTPDCKRACEYYPEFFNDTFKLLFLDDVSDSFRLLSSKDNNL